MKNPKNSCKGPRCKNKICEDLDLCDKCFELCRPTLWPSSGDFLARFGLTELDVDIAIHSHFGSRQEKEQGRNR